jgi:ZIP family zinc transporter
MVFLFAVLTFILTLLGGLFALRFHDKLHLILGFSAGSVMGVAFFDLLPEAMKLGSSQGASGISATIALGFLSYLVLDRLIFFRSRTEPGSYHAHRGQFGALTMSIHSSLDGIALGLSFQIGWDVGLVVALAVLCHDFSDGINTVNLVLKDRGDRKLALRWLLADALAPLFGVFLTLFFSLPDATFGRVLAVFCGFFLYIGAADLLPESQHAHPTRLTTLTTIMGAMFLYIVIRIGFS